MISDNSPTSPIYFSRQAETCGACHDKEARDWAQSVHGKAVLAGSHDAPTCTGCHDEHKIRSLKSSSAMTISEDVCSRCHASERLNTKYNLPADRVKTFFESYHGLAAQYGSTVAANCASCHGFHKILPSSDTNSTISKIHLVETCGKCHPGANTEFSLGKIHVAPDGQAGGDGFWQPVEPLGAADLSLPHFCHHRRDAGAQRHAVRQENGGAAAHDRAAGGADDGVAALAAFRAGRAVSSCWR